MTKPRRFALPNAHQLVFLTLVLGLGAPSAPAQQATDWTAAGAAAAEVNRQLNFMMDAVSGITGSIDSPAGGLYKQIDSASYDLLALQQRLKAQDSREALYLAFASLDSKIKNLADDLKNFEKWDVPLRFVIQRLQAAQHDLFVALAFGDDDPQKQSSALMRQTLGLVGRTEALERQVVWVFSGYDSLAQWKTALKDYRGAIGEFQRLQQNKAESAALKDQLALVNKQWLRLVERIKAIPDGQYLLVQQSAADVDAALVRLDRRFGITSKARLPNPWN